jgi:enterochelin esterase-like enzyme
MSVGVKHARSNVWLEGLGEWSWPGRGGVAIEALPPSWVPAVPPRLERFAAVPAAVTAPVPWSSRRAIPRRLGASAFLSCLAAAGVALTLAGPARLLNIVGLRIRPQGAAAVAPGQSAPAAPGTSVAGLPLASPVALSHDTAGSAIDVASYASPALRGQGSYLVYLPPGFGSTTRHYPVLYLLHGNGQRDSSFLDIGLQGTLDHLIARHAVPPLIAVMIQGGQGTNNWRDLGAKRYATYVLEVQALVDRTLPTVADRAGRAIAGYSMGGYGAMNIALTHPERFAVVESWLGFFAGLERELRADRLLLSRVGLRAFVYGGASDVITSPSQNAPFAAALRAAGARAESAVYPGGHSLETLHAHLGSMLAFAGRALSAPR